MAISKILSLSLLLISSLAFARVEFHTEFKDAKRYPNSTRNVAFQIDSGEFLEIYNLDDVRIVAELLVEEEATATVQFTIYGKNDAGEYAKVVSPVLAVNYAEPAVFSVASSEGENFTMTVQADKV